MPRAFDISVLGQRELERRLRSLDYKMQGKAVRPALRNSAKRAKERIVHNLNNDRVQRQTGTLINAFAAQKPVSANRRGQVRVGVPLPDRSSLGKKAEPGYYPTAVEYGHVSNLGGRVPAYPYIRPAIDEHRDAEFAAIAKDIRAGIDRLVTNQKVP